MTKKFKPAKRVLTANLSLDTDFDVEVSARMKTLKKNRHQLIKRNKEIQESVSNRFNIIRNR
ncbi:hypothetical protein [Secundilactobacillus mixtipabuli]|uniref:Uncharacterized protein n=1 Tax=Secundilactobacillus mixtipabuli TaxID=1435342 RepID=A0A1Z5ID80_9LACO|nr:hypothetical protein [Secundilactobacillus mixtipabuli]GAW99694.1 hypothetical protein IWT30_01664 [Secundilactobacillus mixtipabuli]